jgi:hypothetical protein
MAVVICRDVRDLYAYLSHQLGAIEEVLTYEVNVRTQRLKQHGSVIAHGRLMNPAPRGRSTSQRDNRETQRAATVSQ